MYIWHPLFIRCLYLQKQSSGAYKNPVFWHFSLMEPCVSELSMSVCEMYCLPSRTLWIDPWTLSWLLYAPSSSRSMIWFSKMHIDLAAQVWLYVVIAPHGEPITATSELMGYVLWNDSSDNTVQRHSPRWISLCINFCHSSLCPLTLECSPPNLSYYTVYVIPGATWSFSDTRGNWGQFDQQQHFFAGWVWALWDLQYSEQTRHGSCKTVIMELSQAHLFLGCC